MDAAQDIKPPVAQADPRFAYTGSGYWGGSWYPYWTVLLLSVLGGFFGLDHLWLRSPLTAGLKFGVNMLSFGSWWIYDILQVFGDSNSVKKNGLSIPFFGPQGIAAGVFRDSPDAKGPGKSPLRWLAYIVLLFVPFGFDRAVAGDMPGAAMKFFLSFMPLLWIFVFVWTLIDIFRAVVSPTALWEQGVYRIFPLNLVLSTYKQTSLGPNEPGSSGSGVCNIVAAVAKPVVDLAAGPIAAASGAAVALGNTVATVADSASRVVKIATDTTLPMVEDAVKTGLQQKVDQKIGQITGPALISPFKMMGGGLGDSVGFGAVAGTGALLLGSGLLLGALRIKEVLAQNRNGTRARDDRPPEPRTV